MQNSLRLWLLRYQPSVPKSQKWVRAVRAMQEILSNRSLRKAFVGAIGIRTRSLVLSHPQLGEIAPLAREYYNFLRAHQRGLCPPVSEHSLVMAGAALLYLTRPKELRDYLFGHDNPKKVFRYVWAEIELDLRIYRDTKRLRAA